MSRILVPALRATVIAAAFSSPLAQAATAVWVGGATELPPPGETRSPTPLPAPYWDVAGNWAPAKPRQGDVAQLGAFDTGIRSGDWALSSLSGTGRLEVNAGSLLVRDGASVGGLVLSGGALGGAGRLTLSGLDWRSGSMGSDLGVGGLTAVNGSATWSGSSLVLGDGRVLELNGDARWTASGTLTLGGAGSVVGLTRQPQAYGASRVSLAAGSTLTVASAGSHVVAGDGVFNNAGTVAVAVGSGGLTLNDGFVNAGTVDARQGTLVQLPNHFINPGRLTGDGSFGVGPFGFSTVTNTGHIAPGESLGPLSIQGNLVQTAAGALDIELQGPGTFDQLKVTRAATLDGTLHLVCHADCSFSAGQSLTLLDASPGQLQGSFSNVALSGFGRGAFEVVYDRINGDVLLNVLQATAPVPEPGVGLLLASGLLALAWRRRQGSPSQ